MITASHNPARWNGFKVKPWYGGSAPAEVTAAIEHAIPAIAASERVSHMPLGEAESAGLVERVDVRNAYLKAIGGLVDLEAIRAAGFHVLIDSMFGAAQGWLARSLADGATATHELHGERNPSFPGIRAPEPIAANLGEAMELIAGGGYHVGLATDGDGDRFGLIDEQGHFVTQLQTFALLVHYFLEVRGERGPIVRSVTMTRMVDRLGEAYGCPVYETPVGFKYLGPKMTETKALIAGEESGGYAFRGHIPERDGLLSALYVLDYMARTGKRPSELLADLYARVGPHQYDRVDITIRADERAKIEAHVRAHRAETIAGLRVDSRDEVDGYRFNLEGGWWLLLRFSGTEPLLRIYAELPTAELVQQALAAAQKIAGVTL
jgi:phosphomannomutase